MIIFTMSFNKILILVLFLILLASMVFAQVVVPYKNVNLERRTNQWTRTYDWFTSVNQSGNNLTADNFKGNVIGGTGNFTYGNYSQDLIVLGNIFGEIPDSFKNENFSNQLAINMSDIRETAWDFANNDSLVLDNRTILRNKSNAFFNTLEYANGPVPSPNGTGMIYTNGTTSISTSEIGYIFRTGSSDVWLPSGNLGIGTDTPSTKLDIKLTSGTDGIRIEESGAGTQSWTLTNANGDFIFFDVGTPQVVFKDNGGVGFGTNAPFGALHLKDNHAENNLTFESIGLPPTILAGQGFGSIDFYSSDTSGEGPGYIARIRAYQEANSGFARGNIGLFTGWTANDKEPIERMTLNEIGNIGINKTDPVETLDVIGTFSVVTADSVQGLFQDGTGRVGIGTSSPNSILHVTTSTSTTPLIVERTGGNAVKFEFQTGGNNAGLFFKGQQASDTWTLGAKSDGFHIDHGEGFGTDEFFTILESGNVGIGTTTPTSKLHVIGDINATGNITSGNGSIIIDGNNRKIIGVELIATINGTVKINISINETRFQGQIINIDDINASSRYIEQNKNNGSNATSAIQVRSNVGRSCELGIGSDGFEFAGVFLPNAPTLICRTPQPFFFTNTYPQGWRWVADTIASDIVEDTMGNIVAMRLSAGGHLNVTNVTIQDKLILPNVVQLPASQSTTLVRDDESGVVGTKFGVRNTVPSTDTDSGVSYILDVGSGNNMSLDLHSSLDLNNPLTVVSHYNNDVLGHVWRLNPSNDNAFFAWEVGKHIRVMTINKTGQINFNNSLNIAPDGNVRIGNSNIPLNISGYNKAGQLGYCGMDDNFVWSCSAG